MTLEERVEELEQNAKALDTYLNHQLVEAIKTLLILQQRFNQASGGRELIRAAENYYMRQRHTFKGWTLE